VRKNTKKLLYILIAAALACLSGCLPDGADPESAFASMSPAATGDTAQAREPEQAFIPDETETDGADEDEIEAGPTEEPAATVAPGPTATPSPTPTPTPSPTPSVEATEDGDEDETDKELVEMTDVTVLPTGNFGSPYADNGRLSETPLSWYFMKNHDHQPPNGPRDFDVGLFGGYYLGDVNKRVVYLTFDEGYEIGYTGPILDILKEHGVPAAFFLTQTYIRDNPELVRRMADEGHVAANHSATHRSIPGLTDEEIADELNGCADYFYETTGALMDMFFRPPEGNYSARSLSAVYGLGYRTIFWSFAYVDWNVNDQPGKDAAYEKIMDGVHNGAILLLHAVSVSNAEALPGVIADLKAMDFEFGSLYDLK